MENQNKKLDEIFDNSNKRLDAIFEKHNQNMSNIFNRFKIETIIYIIFIFSILFILFK